VIKYIVFLITTITFISFINGKTMIKGEKYPLMQLSDYGFFRGNLKDLDPTEDVLPYDLNTPLFSDYALKARFMWLPKDGKLSYQNTSVLGFPEGSILIKNFYYPADFRKPDSKISILETRLLILEEQGWKAYPYIWNEEQTEAYLEVAGGSKQISWRNIRGKKVSLRYSIPNVNECKGCHVRNQKIQPIGPTARQLNRDFDYTDGKDNQLDYLEQKGLITLPDKKDIPRASVWNDPSTGTLDIRARDYLDINCGHCHNPEAPANTSGLFLNFHEGDPVALGINKSPIAAGRGSGNRLFDIVPGKPDESILIYRMESSDPGVMMPEIGRGLVHKEGVALIREWVRAMD
jgi:uncharacterized repeat protein (TIGR03806 family)